MPGIVEIRTEMAFENKQRSPYQLFEVRTRAEDPAIAQAQLGSIMISGRGEQNP